MVVFSLIVGAGAFVAAVYAYKTYIHPHEVTMNDLFKKGKKAIGAGGNESSSK